MDLRDDAPAEQPTTAKSHRAAVPGLVRRHPALTVLCLLALVLVIGVGSWLFVLNNRIGDIPRFEADFDREDRPERVQPAGALNVLLVGVDGRGDDVRERIQDGETGILSDTMMIWHLSEDHQTSQVVSVPRDSWVDVPGHGQAKINAAFSWGGPELLVETLEDTLDIYIDHVAIVDFEGFRDITETLGGVEIEMADGSTENLEGEEALAYVRERKSLPRGDFDRINRQQNFLRQVLWDITRTGTRSNPVTMTNLIGDLSKLLLLDDDFDDGEIRSLGLEIVRKGAGEIDWMTVPTDGTGTSADGQSIVNLDVERARELFEAISKDEFEEYRKDNPVDFLPKKGEVL
ncbi:LCP family protein [Nocardioides antri]|uniref:LCP family protein n=1 Tax=Nocardioides antri TaxID=2607659 RepID=UPI00165FE947|nr:LCP family protein [Nocardioides antri]